MDKIKLKILMILSIIFAVLTFIGVAYVLLNKGEKNAGYAIIPMVFFSGSITTYRRKKADSKEKK